MHHNTPASPPEGQETNEQHNEMRKTQDAYPVLKKSKK